jgi:replicative DNA helicase
MSQLVDPSISGQFDRLPPHSIEAEMCLLASMMLDKEMIGTALQLVDREAFYQADHQIIFDILIKLYEQNKPVDAIIVREELGKRQLLDEIGGTAYLAQILSAVPSAAHGAHYAGIIREKSLLRQLISASNEVLREAYAPHEKADVILDRAEHKIFDIAQKKIGGRRGLRDDRGPRARSSRAGDGLPRSRRHAQRPAEQRDDHHRRKTEYG